jgi:hypothetical protein
VRGPYDRIDYGLLRMIDEIMRQEPTPTTAAERRGVDGRNSGNFRGTETLVTKATQRASSVS